MNYCFNSSKVATWICEKINGRYIDGDVAFGVEVDGILKAGVMYEGYTGENGTILMHWRVDDPKILTRFFYWMAFDYPFNHAKVKSVTGLVDSSNIRAIRVDEKLGFKCEARLVDYFPKGDALVFRMFKDDCRFLGEKYAPRSFGNVARTGIQKVR